MGIAHYLSQPPLSEIPGAGPGGMVGRSTAELLFWNAISAAVDGKVNTTCGLACMGIADVAGGCFPDPPSAQSQSREIRGPVPFHPT
jgi:hypothetical protein